MRPSGTIPRNVKEISHKEITQHHIRGKKSTWTSPLHRKCTWENSPLGQKAGIEGKFFNLRNHVSYANLQRIQLVSGSAQYKDNGIMRTPQCPCVCSWEYGTGMQEAKAAAGGGDGCLCCTWLEIGTCISRNWQPEAQEFREGTTSHQNWGASDGCFMHIPQ